MRESKEAVALENGEKAERDIIDRRYKRILENWRHRINREFILGIFTRPYYMTVLRIPLFLAFPAYMMGYVALGGLMAARFGVHKACHDPVMVHLFVQGTGRAVRHRQPSGFLYGSG